MNWRLFIDGWLALFNALLWLIGFFCAVAVVVIIAGIIGGVVDSLKYRAKLKSTESDLPKQSNESTHH